MVVSKLDTTINYKETRSLSDDDRQLEVEPFILTHHDISLMCALGNEKYTYVAKNIIYFPIYVIHNGKVALQIGIFEVLATELSNVLDGDNNIDIDLLNEPLFFSFASKSMISKYKYDEESEADEGEDEGEYEEGEDEGEYEESEDEEGEESEEEGEEEEYKEGEDEEGDEEAEKGEEAEEYKESETEEEDEEAEKGETEEEDAKESSKTVETTSTDAIIKNLFAEDTTDYNEHETYSAHKKTVIDFKKGTNWIQQYFKNPNYTIIDNEGGGDCLFAVIRDAYASIGKDISVFQLRTILANAANETIFSGYKMMYDMFNDEVNRIRKELKTITNEHNALKKRIKVEKNITKKKLIINESKKLVKKHKDAKEEYVKANDLLEEYRFMTGIETLDDFKDILKTCKFWGETWAISTLERALNMKLIILSTQAYQSGDVDNVIMCGQLNDDILREKGEFKPKYYIITEWLGYHYKSVAYKDEKIITYDKIPYGIREKIVEKCLERGEGPFSIIPKFKTLKERIQTRVRESIGEGEYKSDEDGETSIQTSISESSLQSVSSKEAKPTYNKGVIFQFYEKSADKKPGHGSGETITPVESSKYITLSKIKDWRRKLSNGYMSEFTIDGKRWGSIEHYYQAHKFIDHKDIFNLFSLDSNSDVSKSYDLAKIAGSNKPVKDGKELRTKKVKPIVIDDATGRGIMMQALRAKFTQNEELKRILLATNDAGLFVFIRGIPAKEYSLLMDLRREIE